MLPEVERADGQASCCLSVLEDMSLSGRYAQAECDRVQRAEGEGGVGRDWRKLRSYELRDSCSSPSVTSVIKWKGLTRAGHMACRGVKKNAYIDWVGKLQERDHLEDLGVGGRVCK
jgi:hypothetical protein